MSEERNKIINIIATAIIVILIIIIIILLFRKYSSELKPSGNIDIFEITCTNSCETKGEETNKNDENTKEQEDVKTENTNNQQEQIETEIKENFSVINTNGIAWDSTKKLNIFSNPMYEMKEKIAPEATNIYQFVVRNNTIYNLKYKMTFIEENDMNINMKYRLKKNDEYIIGNENEWVKYSDLNISGVSSKTKTSDTYYLEWKWFSSDNDTAIGEKGSVDYTLKINIKADQEL